MNGHSDPVCARTRCLRSTSVAAVAIKPVLHAKGARRVGHFGVEHLQRAIERMASTGGWEATVSLASWLQAH